MAISSYEKDGKTLWRISIHLRNPNDRTKRAQKMMSGFESEKAAASEEKKIVRELTEKIQKRATQGENWGEVVKQWELTMRSNLELYGYQLTTVLDHAARLRLWTSDWFNRPAQELNRGDAREVMLALERDGKSREYQRKIKHTVNVVFDWGVEARLIKGVSMSPMQGLKTTVKHAEKVPDILTLEEIRRLLSYAKSLDHPWYPIWVMALLTGMRNGELHAILWSDVDLDNRRLTVDKSFHTRRRIVKSTKSGSWRTVPISDELYSFLVELKANSDGRTHVLPRNWRWDMGRQAIELRAFCDGIGIKSIRFHALRACFATQLLANDVPPAVVMKICGWAEFKTMQRYIRMAGIEEKGATQTLKFMPTEAFAMGKVVDLFEFKSSK